MVKWKYVKTPPPFDPYPNATDASAIKSRHFPNQSMAGGEPLAVAGAAQEPGPAVEGGTPSTSTGTASEAAVAVAEAEGEAQATIVVPSDGGEGEGNVDVEALVAEMGRLSRRLRDEHGVACAILGKGGGVVALPLPATPSEQGYKGPSSSSTEKADSGDGGDGAAVVGARSVVELAGGLVGHEEADVVLQIEGGAVQYLHASSGEPTRRMVVPKTRDPRTTGWNFILTRSSFLPSTANITYVHNRGLSRYSPYFSALFAHPFAEAQSRIVELHLPCPAMLAPTLYHLYTGKAPEPLRRGGPESLGPDELFGLLANAKYLLLEQGYCVYFLARALKAGTHDGKRVGWWSGGYRR